MNPEAKLAQMGLELPPAPKPMGVYKPLMILGNIACLSGHGPLLPDGTLMTGKVGVDIDAEQAKLAARQTGLAILATLKDQLGSLDRIAQVYYLMGLVNASPDFDEHPQVINGCSELFAELFGPEKGIGTRTAFGASSLPGKISVEIESTWVIVPEPSTA